VGEHVLRQPNEFDAALDPAPCFSTAVRRMRSVSACEMNRR
jgi:hypothetical protein